MCTKDERQAANRIGGYGGASPPRVKMLTMSLFGSIAVEALES